MAPEIQELLQVFLIAVVGSLATSAGVLINRALFAAVAYIKSRLSASQQEQFELIVRWGIQQAEQKGVIGLIQNTASAKLNEASFFIQNELNKRGLTSFDADAIRAAIEAGILNGYQKGDSPFITVTDNVFAEAAPAPQVCPDCNRVLKAAAGLEKLGQK